MSVTRVPLHPIEKGSLTKLWLGVIIALVVAVAMAFVSLKALPQTPASFLASNSSAEGVETTESGLQFKTLVDGQGDKPTTSDVTLINYRGELIDGTVFDENQNTPMPVTGPVPGFSEALQKMQRGGKYRIWIPPALGYGAEEQKDQSGKVVIPANSVLVFDVELLEFIPEAQLRAMQQQMQGGAGGGLPPGAQPVPGPPPGQ